MSVEMTRQSGCLAASRLNMPVLAPSVQHPFRIQSLDHLDGHRPGSSKNRFPPGQKDVTDLLPLVIDLTNPSPAIGWDNQERESFYYTAGLMSSWRWL